MKPGSSKASVVDGRAKRRPDGAVTVEGSAAMGTSRLIQLVLSRNAADRKRAARSLIPWPSRELQCFLLRLLKDNDAAVRAAALMAAGYADRRSFGQDLVEAIGNIEARRVAASVLVALGADIVPIIRDAYGKSDKSNRLRLIRILERIRSPKALQVLADDLQQSDEGVRTAIVQALNKSNYRADERQVLVVEQQIGIEVEHAAGLLAARADMTAATAPRSLKFLSDVIGRQLARTCARVHGYLSMLSDDRNGEQLHQALTPDVVIPYLLAAASEQQLQERLSSQPRLGWTERLITMLERSCPIVDNWLWSCTAHSIAQLNLRDARLAPALSAAREEVPDDRLKLETVGLVMARLDGSARC